MIVTLDQLKAYRRIVFVGPIKELLTWLIAQAEANAKIGEDYIDTEKHVVIDRELITPYFSGGID